MPAPAQETPGLEPIAFTLEGRGIQIANWGCTSRVNWGYDRFTGQVQESWGSIDQGMLLTAYRPNGEVLHQGRIVAPPKIKQGIQYVGAVGQAIRVAKV